MSNTENNPNEVRKIQVLTTQGNVDAAAAVLGQDYAASLLVNMLNTYATSPAISADLIVTDVRAALENIQQGNIIRANVILGGLVETLTSAQQAIPGWVPYQPDMGIANRVIPRELHQPIIERDQAGESLEQITAWVKSQLTSEFNQPAERVNALTPEAIYKIIRRHNSKRKAGANATG